MALWCFPAAGICVAAAIGVAAEGFRARVSRGGGADVEGRYLKARAVREGVGWRGNAAEVESGTARTSRPAVLRLRGR